MSPCNEPNYETACQWWSDARDYWTPIGWKDHFFRFNILFNGAIVANPAHPRNLRARPWAGQGLQIALWPTPINSNRSGWPIYHRYDNGLLRQGWEETPAPLLWTEWAEDGALFHAHVFAHMEGGGEVESGIEPLFAWMRLSVHRFCDPLPMDKRRTFVMQLTKPHVQGIMPYRNNRIFDTTDTTYPRRLRARLISGNSTRGLRLIEPDGKVRLAVTSRRECGLRFKDRHPTDPGSFLWIEIDSRVGAHGLRLSSIIVEKNPADGRYASLTGTIKHEAIWSVNFILVATMRQDCMGRHADAARYLRIFKDHQGTFVPPADGLPPHRGCYATPRSHACVDWFADHGAILYAVAQHALWSPDETFIVEWTDSIVAACEFMQYARRLKHRGVSGLLATAVAAP